MDIDYKAIGRRVKQARTTCGYGQEKLAEIVELSIPYISNIETGRTKMSLQTLVSIANALSVSADDLLCDNVKHTKNVFEKETYEIFNDSTAYETRVLVDIVRSAKQALRANARFIDKEN